MPNDPQWQIKAREAERRLIRAGWVWSSQLAVDCERFGVHISDFGDRLCGAVCDYLRHAGENGYKPALAGAERLLNEFAVPRDPGELASIIDGAVVPHGSDFADMVCDVLRGAEQRSAHELRQLTRDALRAMKHAFECPRCIACANAKNGLLRPSTRRPILV